MIPMRRPPQLPVRLAWLARLFAAALVLLMPPPASAGPESIRFRLPGNANDATDVLLISPAGDQIGMVPLQERTAVLGPKDVFGLVLQPSDDPGDVDVRDASGASIATLPLPEERAVAIGTQTILLHPFSLHGRGDAYEIDIRDVHGPALSAFAYPDLLLLGVRAAAGDHWITLAKQLGSGAAVVHHYGPTGALAWSFTSSETSTPDVGVSSTGDRAVVGMPLDLRTSQLHLLDASGNTITSRTVPRFLHVRFSPDGTLVLLAGDESLQLLNASDGSERWSESEDELLVPGDAVTFSRDGTRFYVVSQATEPGEESGDVELRTYGDLAGTPTRVARTLNEVPSNQRLVLRGIGETTTGRLQLVGSTGMWLVTP